LPVDLANALAFVMADSVRVFMGAVPLGWARTPECRGIESERYPGRLGVINEPSRTGRNRFSLFFRDLAGLANRTEPA
jgi:hypothetical protein